MKALLEALDSLSRWMGYVSAVVIVILMLLVVSDVVGRYFFNSPVTGSSELACLLMIVIVFPALTWTALTGKHIKVDILVNYLPLKVQAFLDGFTLLLALGTYVFITWRSTIAAMSSNNVSSLLRVPEAPFYWIMTVSLALFSISIIVLIVKRIVEVYKR